MFVLTMMNHTTKMVNPDAKRRIVRANEVLLAMRLMMFKVVQIAILKIILLTSSGDKS